MGKELRESHLLALSGRGHVFTQFLTHKFTHLSARVGRQARGCSGVTSRCPQKFGSFRNNGPLSLSGYVLAILARHISDVTEIMYLTPLPPQRFSSFCASLIHSPLLKVQGSILKVSYLNLLAQVHVVE